MRPVKLSTNLRARQLQQWQIATAVLMVMAAGILAFSLFLARDAALQRAEAAKKEEAIAAISAEIARLEKMRAEAPYDGDLVTWAVDTLPRLDLPGSPSAAELLFELERLMPADVYLVRFEYGREGSVELVATAESRAELTEMLTRLQNGRLFRSVQVMSQQESAPGIFEAHLKLEVPT